MNFAGDSFWLTHIGQEYHWYRLTCQVSTLSGHIRLGRDTLWSKYFSAKCFSKPPISKVGKAPNSEIQYCWFWLRLLNIWLRDGLGGLLLNPNFIVLLLLLLCHAQGSPWCNLMANALTHLMCITQICVAFGMVCLIFGSMYLGECIKDTVLSISMFSLKFACQNTRINFCDIASLVCQKMIHIFLDLKIHIFL